LVLAVARKTYESASSGMRPGGRLPAAAQQRRRRLLVVRFVLGVVCLFILGLVIVTSHARVAALGYEIDRVGRELEQLREENQYLRVQIARLAAPARIAQLVNDRGMNPAERLRFAEVDPELAVAAAREMPEPSRAVVLLLEAPLTAGSVAGDTPVSLKILSQWFFQWLTGVRTVEASSTR